MPQVIRFSLLAVAASFTFSTAWFCLWSVGVYLVVKPDLAVLLFAFGLRMGLMLQCPRAFWPVLLGSEWLLIAWLHSQVGLVHWPLLIVGGILSLIPLVLVFPRRRGDEWYVLLMQGGGLVVAALLQSVPWFGVGREALLVLLLTLTGGLTVAPVCLLFWHYLSRATWVPLGPALIAQPVDWRSRHLLWYLLLFAASLWLQLELPVELVRFAPFCLALPILSLAWRYGWQGALLATLMNAIALIAGQALHDHAIDLLMSLLVQSMTGVSLGAGVQRLRDLNGALERQLASNRQLTERLVEAEEHVRRDVARELHDDIGQTITAIRTQASILTRLVPDDPNVMKGGALIEKLSMEVYESVRRLLGRLRPRQLDDLSLSLAVQALLRELELEAQGIVSRLDWRVEDQDLSEGQRVTLFRVCQEGLNNIVKHAKAQDVSLRAWRSGEQVHLVIEDDGCGLPAEANKLGFGLSGLGERVQAIGGSLSLECHQGTRIDVVLPIRVKKEGEE